MRFISDMAKLKPQTLYYPGSDQIYLKRTTKEQLLYHENGVLASAHKIKNGQYTQEYQYFDNKGLLIGASILLPGKTDAGYCLRAPGIGSTNLDLEHFAIKNDVISYFNPRKNILTREDFLHPETKHRIYYKTYYSSGRIKETDTIFDDNDTQYNVYFYDTSTPGKGQPPQYIAPLTKGLKDGIEIEMDKNGTVLSHHIYSEGELLESLHYDKQKRVTLYEIKGTHGALNRETEVLFDYNENKACYRSYKEAEDGQNENYFLSTELIIDLKSQKVTTQGHIHLNSSCEAIERNLGQKDAHWTHYEDNGFRLGPRSLAFQLTAQDMKKYPLQSYTETVQRPDNPLPNLIIPQLL